MQQDAEGRARTGGAALGDKTFSTSSSEDDFF
jgi:hypothetical protein